MKKCLLYAEICWPLFVRRKSAFPHFPLAVDRNENNPAAFWPLGGHKSAITADSSLPAAAENPQKDRFLSETFRGLSVYLFLQPVHLPAGYGEAKPCTNAAAHMMERSWRKSPGRRSLP
jgi:hypothetical protein